MAARILVVDDDRSLRDLLGLHLRSAGYEVELAEDAIEAGYKVLERAPDMIVCDVNMPYMDGFEFVGALKSDTTLPTIPVVFLTSREDGDLRGSELGAVAYLVKPVRVDALLQVVARHLPGEASA